MGDGGRRWGGATRPGACFKTSAVLRYRPGTCPPAGGFQLAEADGGAKKRYVPIKGTLINGTSLALLAQRGLPLTLRSAQLQRVPMDHWVRLWRVPLGFCWVGGSPKGKEEGRGQWSPPKKRQDRETWKRRRDKDKKRNLALNQTLTGGG